MSFTKITPIQTCFIFKSETVKHLFIERLTFLDLEKFKMDMVSWSANNNPNQIVSSQQILRKYKNKIRGNCFLFLKINEIYLFST